MRAYAHSAGPCIGGFEERRRDGRTTTSLVGRQPGQHGRAHRTPRSHPRTSPRAVHLGRPPTRRGLRNRLVVGGTCRVTGRPEADPWCGDRPRASGGGSHPGSRGGGVVAPGGALLLYEPRLPNPRNRNTLLVRRTHLDKAGLCPRTERALTLLPPLGRRLGPLTSLLHPVLSRVPALRTHRLVIYRAPTEQQ
jgi:hypothetical protein